MATEPDSGEASEPSNGSELKPMVTLPDVWERVSLIGVLRRQRASVIGQNGDGRLHLLECLDASDMPGDQHTGSAGRLRGYVRYDGASSWCSSCCSGASSPSRVQTRTALPHQRIKSAGLTWVIGSVNESAQSRDGAVRTFRDAEACRPRKLALSF